MRRASYLSASASALVLAAAGYLWLSPAASPAAAGTIAAPRVATHAAEGRAGGARRAAARVSRARYVLDYRHQVELDGKAIDPTWVRGIWTTEPLVGGRVAIELSGVTLGGAQGLPAPEEMSAPFQIALGDGGGLAQLGFAPETSVKARGLFTTVACALAYTPGEGDRWTAEEDDRTGRYRAVYERHGDEVIRRRDGFTAGRGARGLDSKQADRLSTSGSTRFRFDAAGLAEVHADERITMRLGHKMPTMVVHVEATLRRLESDTVVARTAELLPLEAIRAHGQGGESSGQDLERAHLGGAKVADVIAGLGAVRALPAHSEAEGAWRNHALLQARALLRLDPASAGPIAEALRERAVSGDPREVALLAGALGTAGTREATAALVDLVSADLPVLARMTVATSLGLLEAPSADAVAALTAAMDDPDVGGVSALGLGAQAHRLMDSDPGAAAALAADLGDRYAQAEGPTERITYVEALANSGAPGALPILREALESDDPRLGPAAAYGLRFIPGPEADALLAGLLGGSAPDPVKVAAIRAIGFRAQADWQARLRAALAQPGDSSAVRAAIDEVLASWPG